MLGTTPVVAALAVALCCHSGLSLAQTSQAARTQQYPYQLTAAELRSKVPDSTSYGIGAYGPNTFVSYRSPDFRIHLRGPGFEDFGTYRITDGGMLCTKYSKVRDGLEVCQTIWQSGPDSIEARLPNGQIFKGVWVPGNPEHL